MIDTIQCVVQNILNHWGLTDYVPGVVTASSPLSVKIDDRLSLKEGNLILTAALGELAPGDKVVMLRVLRGQKYIILAKAVI